MAKNDRLPDLPPSDHSWWNRAEKHKTDLRESKPGCDHYFVHKTGREIFCRECNIGFYVDVDTVVTDGKLFFRGTKLF